MLPHKIYLQLNLKVIASDVDTYSTSNINIFRFDILQKMVYYSKYSKMVYYLICSLKLCCKTTVTCTKTLLNTYTNDIGSDFYISPFII